MSRNFGFIGYGTALTGVLKTRTEKRFDWPRDQQTTMRRRKGQHTFDEPFCENFMLDEEPGRIEENMPAKEDHSASRNDDGGEVEFM